MSNLLILVTGETAPDFAHVALSIVSVHRSHVGEHLRSIETDPIEGRVGELVDRIPRKLLGEKVVGARQSTDLGQLTRVAKGIGENEGVGFVTKSALVVSLSVEELSTQSFTGGHVRVHFDPGSTKRLERSLGYLLLDPGEQGGVELFRPFELLRLGSREPMLWVSVHNVTLGGPRSSRLLLGHGERP